ncbi:hypothetical protein PFISCL1PPCAC_26745, partial [Pristionchus fissidentatus]
QLDDFSRQCVQISRCHRRVVGVLEDEFEHLDSHHKLHFRILGKERCLNRLPAHFEQVTLKLFLGEFFNGDCIDRRS